MVQYENLVISGGGTNGFIHVGALSFLERWVQSEYGRTMTEYFSRLAGTSIGALLCLCIVCGLTIRDIMQLCTTFSSHVLTCDFSLIMLCEINAMRENTLLRECVKEIFIRAFGKTDLTFAELYACTLRELVVCACNLLTSQVQFFNHLTTADVSVTEAVLASMAVPFVYPPIQIDGNVYVDGGCQMNLPICAFPVGQTLALWILEGKSNIAPVPVTLSLMTKQLFRCLVTAQDVVLAECYKEHTRNIIRLRALSAGFLPMPVKNNLLPIQYGYLATGTHMLQHCANKVSALFWLAADHLYLFILRQFSLWCLSQYIRSIVVDT